MSRPCWICGRPASSRHHPTGRDALGAYIDPDLHVPACHSDQVLANEDWYTLGVADVRADANVIDLLQLALARLAVFFARRAQCGQQRELCETFARWCRRWADKVAGAIARLDAACPGWRLALAEPHV